MKGKGKGQEFEREICKKLSLWMSDGKRKDLFWRTAMSGGRATLGHALHGGDVTAIDKAGFPLTERFYFELKFRKDLNLLGLFKGKSVLLSIWNDAIDKALSEGKEPILIFKQNHMPTKFCIRQGYIGFNTPILFEEFNLAMVDFDEILLMSPSEIINFVPYP